jgi:hypothetical protein
MSILLVMDFNDVLEAIDQLSLDAQIELIEILRHRTRERRRDELVQEVQQARRELESNLCPVMTPEEGLASLAGGWEGSDELAERVEEIRRSPPGIEIPGYRRPSHPGLPWKPR